MKLLDYQSKLQELKNRIAAQSNIVLASSAKDRVTARTVYCISDGLNIYFLTSKAYLKYDQIVKNPNVALCFDNVQIEGVAKSLGHPSDAENLWVMEKAKDRKEFNYFAKYKNTVLIEVKMVRMELWENRGRVFMDVEQEECYFK